MRQQDWSWTKGIIYPVGNNTCIKYVYFGVYFLTWHGREHQQNSDWSVQAGILCCLGGFGRSVPAQPQLSNLCLWALLCSWCGGTRACHIRHLLPPFLLIPLCCVRVKLCRVNLYKVRAIPVFQDRIESSFCWWGQEGRGRTQIVLFQFEH